MYVCVCVCVDMCSSSNCVSCQDKYIEHWSDSHLKRVFMTMSSPTVLTFHLVKEWKVALKDGIDGVLVVCWWWWGWGSGVTATTLLKGNDSYCSNNHTLSVQHVTCFIIKTSGRINHHQRRRRHHHNQPDVAAVSKEQHLATTLVAVW